MGRRSRSRASAGAPPLRRPLPRDQRPRAPWHPFPLVELCALLGIVLLVLGLLDLESDRGRAMVLGGMALGSLAGLETSLREHFSGFRSHTLVLAGLPTVALAAVLYFAGPPWPVLVVAAVAAFAGSLVLLNRAYHRRAG